MSAYLFEYIPNGGHFVLQDAFVDTLRESVLDVTGFEVIDMFEPDVVLSELSVQAFDDLRRERDR